MTLSLIFLLFTQALVSAHPFHASVCEIAYNEENKSLEISCRMFVDDLEGTLNQYYDTSLDIMKVSEKAKIDQLVETYLKSHLKFWLNDKSLEFSYLGSELEHYALWCYLEITNLETPETLRVDNRVMLERFDDQINLVHFNKEDKVRSLKLFKDNSSGYLKLKELFN